MKLDVEGAELAALRGAARSLGEQAVDYVLLESSYGSSADEREKDDEVDRR